MLRGYGLYILRLRLRSMKLGILCLVTTASVLTLTVWIRKDVRTNGRSMKHSVGWSNFTGVILLTYMRSGSSLTGDILQQNSNVFYVFEPLRILRDLIKHKKQIQWLNGTVSAIATLNTTDVKRQALIGWLTCNFSLVYAQSFEDSNFLYFGKQTASYNECIYKNYNITITDHSQNVTRIYVRTPAFRRGLEDKCLKRLQNACLSSKVRIIKTIRTSMLTAEAILTELKECKVIHVIRDPRATVLSQIRNDGCNEKRNSTLDCAKRHCENVWNDTLVKEKMLKRFPYRILTILYENVVSKPSLMAELMYKFVGMQFSEVISKYVNRIVLEGNVTGCNVCERSWQVGKHSNTSTYRKLLLERMKRIDILYINSVCKEVLNHYKYKFDIR
ncbi:uncharacterized protein LOC123529275 isoform X2 [Mercenaria mercenaria]|nr:uncharacterized protein LOC123529275 isoform X2 [Mercenaria mercenaria]XP_045165472.1 uncharacterized protein LOC123529275 isoform X2 [Mercenaria mercenaria]XP_053378021.1 uncharacterized protein LOC123529275 isoform X2 [Mercenaria mercenaria]